MGLKTIPDLAESFLPRFVAGMDLSHQRVANSYSLVHPAVEDKNQWRLN